MNMLQLSYAKSRGFAGEGAGVPSSFLMDLPRSEMEIIDKTEDYQQYFDGDDEGESSGRTRGGKQQPASVEWDDICQVDEAFESDGTTGVDFDDVCQLPPEEMQTRTASSGMPPENATLHAALSTAGELAQWAAFQCGRVAEHPDFGSGEIIAVSGSGKKRSVTIQFFSDGVERTFRLSHAQLTIESA